MLKKSENILINPNNPFENCKLEREPIADNLTKIIEGIDGSFVFGIDSPWGTGKSTFIKMWQKKLELEKSKDIFTIYFNAWENDFHGEVLLALIGELDSFLNNNKNVTMADFTKTMGTIGSNLVSWATQGVVNPKELYEGLDSTEERKLFNKYKEYNDLKENIKNNLKEIKEKLGVKKVIFFIDELDRCRPNYAVETLEKIKHLFEVDDYIFVLALDKEQLSHSVSTIYGEGMDSSGYLRRFIDFDYTLPSPNEDLFLDYLFDSYITVESKENFFYLKSLIKGFVKSNDLSLRDITKLFYQINLLTPFIKSNDKESFENVFIKEGAYGFFICLRFYKDDLYKKIAQKKVLSPEEKKEVLNYSKLWVFIKFIRQNKPNTIVNGLMSCYSTLNTLIENLLEVNYTYSDAMFTSELTISGIKKAYQFDMSKTIVSENHEIKIFTDLEFINDFTLE